MDHFAQFILLVAVGLGLLLAGGFNLLIPRAPRSVLAGIALLAVTLSYAAVSFVSEDASLAVQAAGLTSIGLVVTIALGSSWGRSACAAVAAVFATSRGRWGTLAGIGVAVIIGSAVAYDRDDQAMLDQQMRDLDLGEHFPLRVAARARAATDRGQPIELKVFDDSETPPRLDTMEDRFLANNPLRYQIIRRQPATTVSNCHGWVFTGGQYWIGGLQVDTILNDNGYEPVTIPQPGDLVVYRTPTGVAHTAIVRYVSENNPVMVEGKWGAQGVYLHAVDQSCYGTDVTYYRSGRSGHLLTGFGAPGSPRPYNEPLAE